MSRFTSRSSGRLAPTVMALALVGTLALTTNPAQAGDGVQFGFRFGRTTGHSSARVHSSLRLGGSRYGVQVRRGRSLVRDPHHRSACSHRWQPLYRQVWVAPIYRNVFAGYDRCRQPIYRRVCVREGHYQNVLTGHRCSTCGHSR